MIMYKCKKKPKEYMKEKYFCFLKGIKNIDNKIEKFWKRNESKIRKEWLENKKIWLLFQHHQNFY